MKVVCETAIRERESHVLVNDRENRSCYVNVYPDVKERASAYRDYLLEFGAAVDEKVNLSESARYNLQIWLTREEIARLARAAFSGEPFGEVVRLLSDTNADSSQREPDVPIACGEFIS